MAVKTFSVGEVLTASDTNTYLANAGLVYVTSTTFSASSAVSVSNCFSSTYTSYRVIIHLTQARAGITARMRTTSDDSGAVYRWARHYQNANNTNGGATGALNDTSWEIGRADITTTNYAAFSFDLHGPNTATTTIYSANPYVELGAVSTGNLYVGYAVAGVLTTTQYTGFSFFPNVSTLTGTVTVYGYRQA